jgi:hypothetical protein
MRVLNALAEDVLANEGTGIHWSKYRLKGFNEREYPKEKLQKIQVEYRHKLN